MFRQIETFGNQFQRPAFAKSKAAAQTGIESVDTFASARIAPECSGSVGLRTPVAIGVEAQQQIKRSARTIVENRSENEIAENCRGERIAVFRHLENAADNNAMPLVK